MTDQTYSDEELLEAIQQCDTEYPTATPGRFDGDEQFPSVSAISRRFGSWSVAKEIALAEVSGLYASGGDLSDEQALSHIRELERREGHVSAQLMEKHQPLVSVAELVSRFGSFTEAKELAGVEVN
jgi:hypothetical protein